MSKKKLKFLIKIGTKVKYSNSIDCINSIDTELEENKNYEKGNIIRETLNGITVFQDMEDDGFYVINTKDIQIRRVDGRTVKEKQEDAKIEKLSRKREGSIYFNIEISKLSSFKRETKNIGDVWFDKQNKQYALQVDEFSLDFEVIHKLKEKYNRK